MGFQPVVKHLPATRRAESPSYETFQWIKNITSRKAFAAPVFTRV